MTNRSTWLLLIVLAYAAAFRLMTLNRPFDYDDEATGGSFYGLLARNYLRVPWALTHGMPVVTVGTRPGVPLVFYADHPRLVPLMIAPVYKVFGVGEWQTRLPTSIATVLSILSLFALVRRFGTDRAAVFAAALFAAMPMTLYFGGQREVLGMPLVLGALLSVFAYLDFHRNPALRSFALLLGAFTFAALSDWPAFVLVPVLVAHFAMTRVRRQWPWMLVFSLFACAVFALLYVYIAWAATLAWTWMIPLVKGRAALGRAPFTMRQWLGIAWIFNVHHHTLPLLAATVAWVVWRGVVWPGVAVRSAPPGATAARVAARVGRAPRGQSADKACTTTNGGGGRSRQELQWPPLCCSTNGSDSRSVADHRGGRRE